MKPQASRCGNPQIETLGGSVSDGFLVLGLVALICIPVWPGVFNADAQFMLLEARRSGISRNYAPLHGWVWGLADGVGLPPAAVFLFGVAAFVTAVLILVKQFLPDRAARGTTVLIVLSPPVYGLLGLLSRDVWFVTYALLITATVWHLERQSEPPSPLMVVLLVAFGVAAADARQNGTPFAILAIAVAAIGTARRLRPHAAMAFRLVSVAVGLALFFPALLLAQRFVVTHRIFPEQSLYASDLIGVSLQSNRLLLDEMLFPDQNLSVLRSNIGQLDMEGLVYADPPIVRHRNEDRDTNATWMRQWRKMLRDHPIDYLAWRTELYLAQLGITQGVRRPYFDESVERDNGLRPEVANRFPRLLEMRKRLLSAIEGPRAAGSLLARPALYLIGSFGAIVILARRRQQWGPAVALLVALSAMQMILFFTAPGSEFRLEYFQVVIGLAFGSVTIVGSLCGVGPVLPRTIRPARSGL